jgi:hypothetical protein
MNTNKLYILSENPDREVEQTIHEMTEQELRVALYGIARGWKFDEAIAIAIDARKNNSAETN